jgi:hypothetical protein
VSGSEAARIPPDPPLPVVASSSSLLMKSSWPGQTVKSSTVPAGRDTCSHGFGSGFSAFVDPDPYWESGSRDKKMKKCQWQNALLSYFLKNFTTKNVPLTTFCKHFFLMNYTGILI